MSISFQLCPTDFSREKGRFCSFVPLAAPGYWPWLCKDLPEMIGIMGVFEGLVVFLSPGKFILSCQQLVCCTSQTERSIRMHGSVSKTMQSGKSSIKEGAADTELEVLETRDLQHQRLD